MLKKVKEASTKLQLELANGSFGSCSSRVSFGSNENRTALLWMSGRVRSDAIRVCDTSNSFGYKSSFES